MLFIYCWCENGQFKQWICNYINHTPPQSTFDIGMMRIGSEIQLEIRSFSLTRKVWSKFKTKFGCSHYILKSPLSLFHIKKKQLSLLSSPRGSGWTLLLLCPTWQSFHIRLFTLLICNEGKGFPEERYLSSCVTIRIFSGHNFLHGSFFERENPAHCPR